MRNIWLVMMAAAMTTSVALAADTVTPNINKGTKSIEGSGFINGNTPQGTDAQVELGYGYFVKDGLEVAGIAGFANNDIYTAYSLGARIEYNFNLESQLVPFVGLGIVWAGADADNNEDVNNDTAVGQASAGVKWFLRDDVALTFSMVYDKAADDVYTDEDFKAQDDNWQGLFGIRFFYD